LGSMDWPELELTLLYRVRLRHSQRQSTVVFTRFCHFVHFIFHNSETGDGPGRVQVNYRSVWRKRGEAGKVPFLGVLERLSFFTFSFCVVAVDDREGPAKDEGDPVIDRHLQTM
jgi:hypothetical protein